VEGEAIAIDKNNIKVGEVVYTTDNLIIATGSVPNTLNIPGAKEAAKKN